MGGAAGARYVTLTVTGVPIPPLRSTSTSILPSSSPEESAARRTSPSSLVTAAVLAASRAAETTARDSPPSRVTRTRPRITATTSGNTNANSTAALPATPPRRGCGR